MEKSTVEKFANELNLPIDRAPWFV